MRVGLLVLLSQFILELSVNAKRCEIETVEVVAKQQES